MSFRKAASHEFNSQLREIKTQLQDQLKCLEQRTDTQLGIYHEIQDFCKRRAEIDQDYARQLEKLAKSAMIRFKSEKTKRANWNIYSSCNLLMQLVDDTKDEARHRLTIAEVLGNYSNASFNSHATHLQKVSKKCREIGVLAQGEVVRVIDEMSVSMKTYQQCFEQCQTLSEKAQELEAKLQPEDLSTRKRRSIQKNLLKATAKYETAKKKCDRARNEYLLCVDAANASLHKYFGDDLVDIIGCMDVGTDYWTCLLLDNIIAARKVACQSEMNSLAQLSSAVSMMPQCDKQRFFESHNNTFMLPKRFEFRADQRENINELTVEGAGGDLDQRRHQMNVRLSGLRTESQHMRQTLMQAEQRIHSLLAAQHALDITSDGISDNRPQTEALETELESAVEAYTTAFNFFVLNANLIARLEARADGIALALGQCPDSARSHATEGQQNQWTTESARGSLHHQQSTGTYSSPQMGRRSVNSSHPQLPTQDNVAAVAAALRLQGQSSPRGGYDKRSNYSGASGNQGAGSALATPTAGSSLNTSTNSTRSGNQFGQTMPHFTAHPQARRPRLFGGSLEEYTQATGEKIPTIVTSCIRALSQFAAHHQGVFRVSGSHTEINNLKDAFEEGYNPLENICEAKDANCIAGLLTRYLRELRDPLFPFFLFERILDCAKTSNPEEFVTKISDLIRKLPMSSYLLLRYLFAFLNYVSENSDGNMMDSYNLAVCFGPTLLRVPNSKDQVYYQNFVNEAIKKIIIHHAKIFSANIPGPEFQRPPTEARVQQYADEACTSYTSITPSNSGTASSTLQNNDSGRLILGDEPVPSLSTAARNSVSSRIQVNPSPSNAEVNIGSNANYYSSSAESSTHNLNGHVREPQENGSVLARLSSNDENEHRLNMSNASLNDSATAFRRLCVKDENIVPSLESPKFPVKLPHTSPPLSTDSHKPEIHAKGGFNTNYQIKSTHLNGTNGMNGSVKSGDPIRTLERIRIPVAPKMTSSSPGSDRPPSSGSSSATMPTGSQASILANAVQASINSKSQSPSYLYSTVNKPPRQNSAPNNNNSSILNVMNKFNELDELVAENRLISSRANIVGQHYQFPSTTNNSVPSK